MVWFCKSVIGWLGFVTLYVLLSVCGLHSALANLANGPGQGGAAGSPRFKKPNVGTFFIGFGVGSNVYNIYNPPRSEYIESSESQQVLATNTVDAIFSSEGKMPDLVSMTGYPRLIFGYIPSRLSFMHHQLYLDIFNGFIKFNSVTAQNPISIISAEPDAKPTQYSSLQMNLQSYRVMYNLQLQYDPPRARVGFFVLGGVGVAIDNTWLQGSVFTPTTSSSSSGTNSGTSTSVGTTTTTTSSSNFNGTESKFLANTTPHIGMVYEVGGGMMVYITQGFAVDIRFRYAFFQAHFDANKMTTVDFHQNSLDLIASAILKF